MTKIIQIILILALVFLTTALGVLADTKIKIGLLVPLTGKNSEIGQSIINIKLIAINKINNSSIEIIPKDTKSNPADTLKAAKEFQQLGIKIVIGPVFNKNQAYIDELKEITFISLTNNS